MIPNSEYPEVLISVPDEVEAAAIVGALAEHGVEAITTGEFISHFKGQAPSNVDVVVKRSDLHHASMVLADIQQQQAKDIDWDSVDVMEDYEEEPPSEPIEEDPWEPNAGRVWLSVGLLVTFIALLISMLGGFAHPLAIGLFVAILIELALCVLFFWKDHEP